MNQTIAVIGAGNGGTAIAAYLASRGAKVNLTDLFPEYLKGIQNAKGIDLTLDGKTAHYALNSITTDIASAIMEAKLIMVVTPAFTHKLIAQALAPFLGENQMIVLNPGRTGGALEFANTAKKCGCRNKFIVSEAQTLIYSCRRTGECGVEIYGVKREVLLGTLPACRSREVIETLHPYYPQFRAAKNCLQTSLANIGALFHPAPVLLNIGRIECAQDFRYYPEGITPSVAALIEAIDTERLAVSRACHVDVLPVTEWLRSSYETEGDTLYQLIQNNQAYRDIHSPKNLHARYITEDVPMSLVPIAEFGRLAGVATPNIDAVITMASSIYNEDFRAQGRTLQSLGLEGMSMEQVISYFETGVRGDIADQVRQPHNTSRHEMFPDISRSVGREKTATIK